MRRNNTYENDNPSTKVITGKTAKALKEAPNSCAAQCKKGTSEICFLPRDSKNVVFHAETSCCSERSFLISLCSQLFQDVVLLVAGLCSRGCFYAGKNHWPWLMQNKGSSYAA